MILPALSIRQPWAWLIVQDWKDIENREWPTGQRGRFLIHAGKAMTRADYDACQIFVSSFWGLRLPSPESLQRGGIVGEATLLDCVTSHASEWFVGRYGLVLADQRSLPFFPCKGSLGFFRVDYPFPATEEASYQQLCEELLPKCTCTPASDRPCAGLLAGGLCDDLQLGPREDTKDDATEAREDDEAY